MVNPNVSMWLLIDSSRLHALQYFANAPLKYEQLTELPGQPHHGHTTEQHCGNQNV